jgi:hypothetical protein
MLARNKSHYGNDKHNGTLTTKQQAAGSAKNDLLNGTVNSITPMPTNTWSSRPSNFIV